MGIFQSHTVAGQVRVGTSHKGWAGQEGWVQIFSQNTVHTLISGIDINQFING